MVYTLTCHVDTSNHWLQELFAQIIDLLFQQRKADSCVGNTLLDSLTWKKHWELTTVSLYIRTWNSKQDQHLEPVNPPQLWYSYPFLGCHKTEEIQQFPQTVLLLLHPKTEVCLHHVTAVLMNSITLQFSVAVFVLYNLLKYYSYHTLQTWHGIKKYLKITTYIT